MVVAMRRRKRQNVVLVPFILAIILVVLLILDKNEVSLFKKKPTASTNQNNHVSVTTTIHPTQLPTTTPEPTQEPLPTSSPTKIPTATPTPTSSPTPTTTPTPKPTESDVDKPTTKPTDPSQNTNDMEDGMGEAKINVLYRQDGDEYSLIADGNTHSLLILNRQDGSIRDTGYSFHQKYTQPNSYIGPIIGYKNNHFIFIADKQIVISDGVTENTLVTLNDDISNEVNLSPVVQSENRILLCFEEKAMYLIDCRNFSVETYNEEYSENYLVLTDEYFSFSTRHRIPAGPYYQFLYTGDNGKSNVLAMIGEIQEYTVDIDNNFVTIKADDVYQLNLKTQEISTTKKLDKERTLYLPVFADGILEGLTDIRFINRNSNNEQVVLRLLPFSYNASCYYSSYYNTFFFTFYLPEKANLLPGSAGSFSIIDTSIISLRENKFIRDSSVKELLYSGQTSIGDGEIYLLERYETLSNESVAFEIVYAWIPIEGSTHAYQLYLYVPRGEDYQTYLELVKQLL